MNTELGQKHLCQTCHTRFYDLNKPEPLCPKCGHMTPLKEPPVRSCEQEKSLTIEKSDDYDLEGEGYLEDTRELDDQQDLALLGSTDTSFFEENP